MFERYTEAARRVIFLGRYEAAKCGIPYIETEHLLLGLLHQGHEPTLRLLWSEEAIAAVETQINAAETAGPASTAVDLPLSDECKRVLTYGAEEAERMRHRHIGTEPLLLELLQQAGIPCGLGAASGWTGALARSRADRQTISEHARDCLRRAASPHR